MQPLNEYFHEQGLRRAIRIMQLRIEQDGLTPAQVRNCEREIEAKRAALVAFGYEQEQAAKKEAA